MTTRKAQSDMDAAYKRLNEGLDFLDSSPAPGPVRARTTRESATKHLTLLADNIDGKKTKCDVHPTEFAINCGPCRSEQLTVPPPLPETPADARQIDARKLGERDLPPVPVVHIAGVLVTINTFQRQRCSWCGAVLIDRDLATTMVPEETAHIPLGSWPPGELVAVDGGMSYVVNHQDTDPLPDGACGKLDPAVTA